MSNDQPDFIIVGPPKCATTWIYDCLKEHPDIFMPETDSVNYFDMNFHRDLEWYLEFFDDADNSQVVGEESPQYFFDINCAERISKENPDVKIIMCLRNPMKRSFSHYWHEKKKNKILYDFNQVLDIYPIYHDWLSPGFYHQHLKRFKKYFPEENIEILVFDDLKEDDEEFIQSIFDFIDVKPEFKPSLLDEKSNSASGQINRNYQILQKFIRDNFPRFVVKIARPVHRKIHGFFRDDSEYKQGMDNEMRKKLEKVYIEDTRKLSEEIGRDLSNWFKYHELD